MVPRVYAECKRNAKKRLTALFSSGIIRVSQVFSFGDVEMSSFDVQVQSDEFATDHEEFLALLEMLADEDQRDEEILFQMMMEE